MTAERFRKKPVVIEAVQFDGNNGETIRHWTDGMAWPARGGDHLPMDDRSVLAIETLEGRMIALNGDWIIRGVKGEFYPCKPDIFDTTYEPVAEVPE